MASKVTARGRLVLDDRVAAGRVLVSGGSIERIELDENETGPLICPGYVDVHVHGHGGHDAMDGPTALDGMARALLRRGVTTFLPTAVTAPLPTLRQFAEVVRTWRKHAPADGAQALGFNLEGPFIDRARKGAQNPDFILSPTDVSTGELEPLLDDWKMVTIAPELPGAIELIRWLRRRGVVDLPWSFEFDGRGSGGGLRCRCYLHHPPLQRHERRAPPCSGPSDDRPGR